MTYRDRFIRILSNLMQLKSDKLAVTKIHYLGKLKLVHKNNIPVISYKPGQHYSRERRQDYMVSSRSIFLDIIDKYKDMFYSKARKIDEFTIKPPVAVSGMKVLDKSAFRKTLKVPAIKVETKNVNSVVRNVKKYMLKLSKIRQVVDLAEDDQEKNTHKLILIDPQKVAIEDNIVAFPEDVFSATQSNGNKCHVFYVDVDVSFENWSVSDVLDAVLPEDMSISAYETVGHIAHLNLKDNLLDFKHIIGEVIMEKSSFIRTVVNKVVSIDSTYRNFAMELLAGEPVYMTTHRENGCTYEMDYSKVYWNSRLSTEHQRLVDKMETDSVVYDIFAGIGPFAIPAAKQGCLVLANDLNPQSFYWLQRNVKLNKVGDAALRTFNLDGRDFVKSVVKPDLLARWHSDEISERTRPIHIVMNLPGMAIDFLDSFRNLLEGVDSNNVSLPTIHCYCFAASDEQPVDDICRRIASALNTDPPDDAIYRLVRHVAPNKDMYCVSFTLAGSTIHAEEGDCKLSNTGVTEPEAKRLKLDVTQ